MEIAKETGFEIKDSDINPALKPHQRDSVRWAGDIKMANVENVCHDKLLKMRRKKLYIE